MSTRHYRWSDHDRYLGPFTYANERRASYAKSGGYRPLTLMLCSDGDDEDAAGDGAACRLRVSALGHTLIVSLPGALLRPWREKVYPRWDAATVARLGRDWYWNVHKREYGFTYNEGHLSVHLGRQTHDSSLDQRWGCFLPWTQWRHVRHSFYGLAGEHYWDEPLDGRFLGGEGYEEHRATEEACPAAHFAFDDFDGERLTARVRIEEREWRFGEGRFRWLSLFRRPMVKRSLDVRFSGEVGKRKGSWKGGTLGHSTGMQPGELHEAVFRRYCSQEGLTFVGEATPEAPRGV
jgi:hypothetical protein